MRLRVWSEFLSFDELGSPTVARLLARYNVEPCVQVTDFDGLAPLLRQYPGMAIWLLLPKEQGYWPSERNAERFAARVDELARWAEREHVRIPWLAVDLERPLWQAERLDRSRGPGKLLLQAQLARANLNRRRFARAHAVYQAVAKRARAAGLQLLCAAHDHVRDDLLAGSSLLQDMHEAPVLGVSWDVISVMLYTSLGCDRRWLFEVAGDCRRALGRQAGASIGLTGAGVLGNEPHYSDPEQLAPDIAALKAAGIEDVAIYSLEGILASARPEAWFEMALSTLAAVPRPTLRSRRRDVRHRLLRIALRAVGRA